MNDQWLQSELFPETTSVVLEIRLGISQESSRIGMSTRAVRKPRGNTVSESVTWLNLTENGVLNCVERVYDLIAELEEYHGIELPELVIDRASAPF